jgi:hypothetical protein
MKAQEQQGVDYYEDYDIYGDRELDPWYFDPIDYDAAYSTWLDDIIAQYEDVHQGCTTMKGQR